MKVRGAVLHSSGGPLEVVDLELDDPQGREVRVRFTHAGLCHSDLHLVTGDLGARLPIVLGHEGAGVVEAVGPDVVRVRPGDHVVCSFIPSCGDCRWCRSGQPTLCDSGATILLGSLPGGRFVFSGPAGRYGAMCMLGTFAERSVVHETSLVPVDDDLPLQAAVLTGCGVPTGWGAAVNTGQVSPGDTVIVLGTGGIGMNALQGAAYAGASRVVAVELIDHKRELALRLGATHAVATMAEAAELARQVTNGNGADVTVVATGLVTSEHVTSAVDATGKGGRVVLTGLGRMDDLTVSLPGTLLTLYKKSVRGSVFGDCDPFTDIPKLLGLYRDGGLKLDELVTRTYTLDQVNDGYADLLAGHNVRGVLVHGA